MTQPHPLNSTMPVGDPPPPDKCDVCGRNPATMNSDVAECSHVDCPHRRRAWSDRPSRAQLYRGPWPKNKDRDPEPLA